MGKWDRTRAEISFAFNQQFFRSRLPLYQTVGVFKAKRIYWLVGTVVTPILGWPWNKLLGGSHQTTQQTLSPSVFSILVPFLLVFAFLAFCGVAVQCSWNYWLQCIKDNLPILTWHCWQFWRKKHHFYSMIFQAFSKCLKAKICSQVFSKFVFFYNFCEICFSCFSNLPQRVL